MRCLLSTGTMAEEQWPPYSNTKAFGTLLTTSKPGKTLPAKRLATDGSAVSDCLKWNITIFLDQAKTKFIDLTFRKTAQHRPGVQA